MSKISRTSWMLGVSAAALVVGTPAAAQQTDAAQPVQSTEQSEVQSEQPAAADVIVVTGSRIARPELSSPNPVQSFTAELLEQSGDTSVTDFLVDSPALTGSTTSQLSSGNNTGFQEAGLNLLNLRNLGTQRTLVLVNSRRHVAAFPGTAAVDINTIPVALIERIDVLTGGASALYGADAVSGVVNFVLRRDFEGVRFRGQIGISDEGDAGNQYGAIVAGRNFADGRGNLTLSYDYNRLSQTHETAREFGRPLTRFEILRQAAPTDRPDDPNVPDRVPFNNVRWADSSPDAAVDLGRIRNGVFVPGDFDGIPDFTGSGTPYDRGLILGGSGGRTIGGSSTPTAGYYGDIQPYSRRHNINMLGSFEFSPAARLFVEAKYVDTVVRTVAQPSFDFGLIFAPDDAFLRQRFGTQLTVGGAESPGRDNIDFGFRGYRDRRETMRGVVGFDGRLSDHLRYEVSYNYGRANSDTLRTDDRIEDRFYAAIDTVVGPNGQITCRINLPGQTIVNPNNFGRAPTTFKPGECVPLNYFGFRAASQESLDFVLTDHLTKSRITQQVLSGYLAGDLGFAFELPGGPIGFALGAEYRKETSKTDPDILLQQDVFADFARQLPERGQFDVKEAFAEVNIPLLKGLPFAENLTVGGAVRFSDYSTIGNTTTWSVNGTYAPVRDLTFRGTYSKAVRAPNVTELFAPQAGTFAFVTDPCDVSNRGSGSSTRAANCVTLLANLGLTPTQIANFSPTSNAEASTSRPGTSGGNPLLQEEKGKTWTAGAVLRPRFLPGFSLTTDWYDITLTNTINTFTALQVFQNCVDAPTLSNQFCPLTTRNPTTGFVSGFTLAPQNVARFETSGLDAVLNYRFTLGRDLGSFNIRAVAGYVKKLTFTNSPGAEPDEDVNETDPLLVPKYLGTLDLTWTKGGLTVNYGLAWHNSVMRYTRQQIRGNPDLAAPEFLRLKERWEHDIQVGYAVNSDYTFYAGVNNFTDSKPAFATGGSYVVSPIGRFLYVGVRGNIGSLLGR